MKNVFAIALASMRQDMSRVDRIALNLANVATPGYKREVVAARPFVEVLDSATSLAAAAGGVTTEDPARTPGGVQVLTDTRPGSLRVTGQPLDLALAGDGFFEVSTEAGPAYTRQGDFRVDARGRLVTAQGHAVMGRDGGDIHLTTQTPVIDAAGRITEPDATSGPSAADPGTPAAQLKVVRFDEPKVLERLGGGLVAAGPGMTVAGDAQALVRQGALENGNVSSMQEMVQLMETLRHFESMQKVAQGYDEMIGQAIRKLGDLS